MIDLPKFLTLETAAEIISAAGAPVSKEYIRRKIIDGELKASKIGRGWKIAEADLLAWLEEAKKPKQNPSGRTSAHDVDYALLIENMSKTFRKGSLAERLYEAAKKLPR
jgi:excisionase family DNA binding protein